MIPQDTQEKEGHIRRADLSRILDIFQNLDGMEYRETASRQEPAPSAYPLPVSLRCTLKEYQKTGYYFLRSHYESGTGVLLADDMGLGKTVQIIALLAHLYDSRALSPALLVMPLSLIDNWCSELRKFLPEVRRIYVHQGVHRYRSPELIRDHEIVMTSYETLARDQAL